MRDRKTWPRLPSEFLVPLLAEKKIIEMSQFSKDVRVVVELGRVDYGHISQWDGFFVPVSVYPRLNKNPLTRRGMSFLVIVFLSSIADVNVPNRDFNATREDEGKHYNSSD